MRYLSQISWVSGEVGFSKERYEPGGCAGYPTLLRRARHDGEGN